MQDIAVQMLASKLSGHDYTATDIASVVITGMSVVFIGLILLVLFVSIYGTAFKRKNEKKKAKLEAEKAAAKAAQQTATPVQKIEAKQNEPVIEDGIDDEIVAVIAAAVTAMCSKNGKKPVIKSVRRSVAQRDPWAAAGLADNTRPF